MTGTGWVLGQLVCLCLLSFLCLSKGEHSAAAPAYRRCSVLLLDSGTEEKWKAGPADRLSLTYPVFRNLLLKLLMWKNVENPRGNLATQDPPDFKVTASWS